MITAKRCFFAVFGAIAWIVAFTIGAPAEDALYINYPARPITMVVPFAAGGPTDIVARLLARYMSEALEQQVDIENVVGAGGTIAANRVKRAEPDGYTIMMGHLGTHAAVTGYLPGIYDPVTDFVAIGLAVHAPVVVVARADLPARSLSELGRYLRENSAVMGHAGRGSVSFAFCAKLNRLFGIAPKSVAFNGTEPAMEALIAGRIDYLCDQAPSVVAFQSTGKIRPLAISSAERSPAMPDVPTAGEAGEPGFSDSSWMGLFAPRDTPPAIVTRLNAALSAALDSGELRKALRDIGVSQAQPAERSQAFFAQFVRDESKRWSGIVKAATAGVRSP